jgi:hypothetical protein
MAHYIEIFHNDLPVLNAKRGNGGAVSKENSDKEHMISSARTAVFPIDFEFVSMKERTELS